MPSLVSSFTEPWAIPEHHAFHTFLPMLKYYLIFAHVVVSPIRFLINVRLLYSAQKVSDPVGKLTNFCYNETIKTKSKCKTFAIAINV